MAVKKLLKIIIKMIKNKKTNYQHQMTSYYV